MAKLLNQIIESEIVREHEEWDEELGTVVVGQRIVKQYWTADGVFLAESDPYYCLCKVLHMEEAIDELIEEIKKLEDNDIDEPEPKYQETETETENETDNLTLRLNIGEDLKKAFTELNSLINDIKGV